MLRQQYKKDHNLFFIDLKEELDKAFLTDDKKIKDDIKGGVFSFFQHMYKTGKYWELCSSEIYLSTVETRLEFYLKSQENLNEIDFLFNEISDLIRINGFTKQIVLNPDSDTQVIIPLDYIERGLIKRSEKSQNLKLEYLKKRIKETIFREAKQIQPVEFKGSKVQIVELIKALFENDSLQQMSEKEIFYRFGQFLNVDLNPKSKKIAIERMHGNAKFPSFLKRLISALKNWDSKKYDI